MPGSHIQGALLIGALAAYLNLVWTGSRTCYSSTLAPATQAVLAHGEDVVLLLCLQSWLLNCSDKL
jgi:hypothetical protein